MGANIRIPLRVLLPCLAVSLVAFGAVAAGIAGVSAASGYLMRQTDNNLVACAGIILSNGFVAPSNSGPNSGPVSSQLPAGACDTELLSASGQVLTLAAPGTAHGPAILADGSWLAAHLARPVTVPGAGTNGRWRVVIEAVDYQARRIPYVYGPDDVMYMISGRPGRGSGGMLVVMAGLAPTGRITSRLAAGYAAAAGTVLVLLAGAVLALTQAILRPLRRAAQLAETSGQAAGEEQLRASRTAEAAARRSADEMSQHLAEAALELRRSVSIVHGFAEYYQQQQSQPPAAHLDRMLRRVADEAAQMETLIEGLGPRPPAHSRARTTARSAEKSLCRTDPGVTAAPG